MYSDFFPFLIESSFISFFVFNSCVLNNLLELIQRKKMSVREDHPSMSDSFFKSHRDSLSKVQKDGEENYDLQSETSSDPLSARSHGMVKVADRPRKILASRLSIRHRPGKRSSSLPRDSGSRRLVS